MRRVRASGRGAGQPRAGDGGEKEQEEAAVELGGREWHDGGRGARRRVASGSVGLLTWSLAVWGGWRLGNRENGDSRGYGAGRPLRYGSRVRCSDPGIVALSPFVLVEVVVLLFGSSSTKCD